MCVGERGREVREAWQVGVERVEVWGLGWVRVGWGEVVGGAVGGGGFDDEVVVDVVGGVGGCEVVEGRSIGELEEAMVGVCYGGEWRI